MDHQTSERVNLYARRQYPGDPLLILIDLVEVNNNDTPMAEEWMHLEHRLGGCEPRDARQDDTAGDNWHLFVQLVQAVWTHRIIPRQHNWHLFVQLVQAVWTHRIIPPQVLGSIDVLIRKGGGGGDYHGCLSQLEGA
jgi:hypothetical protein